MEIQNKFESPEHELEVLRQRMAELESAGKNKAEAAREVVMTHVEQAPEEVLVDDHKFTDEDVQAHAGRVTAIKKDDDSKDDYEKVEVSHKEQIEELLHLASEKGILNAATVVKKMNDPHIEDDFHDELIKIFQEGQKT